MPCILEQGKLPIHHPKNFFNRIPGALELYVGPPACCRRTWMGRESYLDPGRASFVFIDETDIALGEEAQQIAPSLHRILERRKSRPKFVQIYYTCAYELVGTDYKALEEELGEEFEGIRFLCRPIHHLEMHGSFPDFETKELELFDVLEGPLPRRDDVVGIIGAEIDDLPGGEIANALRGCGINTIVQPTLCDSYEEFALLPASRLNIQVGVFGKMICEHLQERFGTPWISVPETYSTLELERIVQQICQELGRPAPDYSASFEECEKRASKVAKLYADHPMVIAEFFLLDSVDLAFSLAGYGFPMAGIDLGFAGKSNPQMFEDLLDMCPDITIIDRFEMGPHRFDPEVMVMGKRGLKMGTTDHYFAPTVHNTPIGTRRIYALMDELEEYALKEFFHG